MLILLFGLSSKLLYDIMQLTKVGLVYFGHCRFDSSNTIQKYIIFEKQNKDKNNKKTYTHRKTKEKKTQGNFFKGGGGRGEWVGLGAEHYVPIET